MVGEDQDAPGCRSGGRRYGRYGCCPASGATCHAHLDSQRSRIGRANHPLPGDNGHTVQPLVLRVSATRPVRVEPIQPCTNLCGLLPYAGLVCFHLLQAEHVDLVFCQPVLQAAVVLLDLWQGRQPPCYIPTDEQHQKLRTNGQLPIGSMGMV